MKKWTLFGVYLLCALVSIAQVPDTSRMDGNGSGGEDIMARLMLSRVRNASLSSTEQERQRHVRNLVDYLEAHPEAAYTVANIYTNADKAASVSLFCVAVDLGNVDVVKAFLDAGMGEMDLCTVQLFTTQKVIVSKADYLFVDQSSSGEGSSTSSSSNYAHMDTNWFSTKATRSSTERSSSSFSYTQNDIQFKYTAVAYGEKNVVRTYMANPLDFADGEMFDFLWKEGFRSPNLLTNQALLAAKEAGKTEVWRYIMSQNPTLLADRPTYVSESDYRALLDVAAAHPNSLASDMLARNVLGRVSTSAQAEAAERELSESLRLTLAKKGDNLVPADTVGYGRMSQALAAERVRLTEAERVAAERRAADARAAEAKRRAELARLAQVHASEIQQCQPALDSRRSRLAQYGLGNLPVKMYLMQINITDPCDDLRSSLYGGITLSDKVVNEGSSRILIDFYEWFDGEKRYWAYLVKDGKIIKSIPKKNYAHYCTKTPNSVTVQPKRVIFQTAYYRCVELAEAGLIK